MKEACGRGQKNPWYHMQNMLSRDGNFVTSPELCDPAWMSRIKKDAFTTEPEYVTKNCCIRAQQLINLEIPVFV